VFAVCVCVYGIYVSDPAAIIPCMHATLGLYVAYSFCSLGCDVVLSGGGQTAPVKLRAERGSENSLF